MREGADLPPPLILQADTSSTQLPSGATFYGAPDVPLKKFRLESCPARCYDSGAARAAFVPHTKRSPLPAGPSPV